MARKVISGGITGLAIRFKDNFDDESPAILSGWLAQEPNSYTDFGGEVTTVTRNPISRTRQRKKGTVTDFDASGGFNADFTQHQLTRLLQAFFYANAFQKGSTVPMNSAAAIPVTAVDDATGYAVDNDPDLGFLVSHLVYASSFGVTANNGLKLLTAVSTSALDAAGTADEASPPAAARLDVVGVQFDTADVELVASANDLRMTSTVFDFTTLNLHPGEWVFVGDDSNANFQFALNTPGYARVSLDIPITANLIVFDKTTWTPATTDGAGKTIRMFFGTFLRNMTESEVESAGDVVRHFMDIERTLGRDANGIQSQILVDAFANALTYTQPLSDKIAVDMTFVAMDETFRDGTEGLMSGTRVPALGEEAYNTSTCLFRARMSIVDETLNPSALFAYVQSIELTIENNVTAVKAQGDIGGIDTVEGDFAVGGSATVLFSTVAAAEAIREYHDVTFDAILAQNNAGYVFDIPLLGLGNGRLNVEKDTPITLPLDMGAAENSAGYTASYTNFRYLPDVAMPVV